MIMENLRNSSSSLRPSFGPVGSGCTERWLLLIELIERQA